VRGERFDLADPPDFVRDSETRAALRAFREGRYGDARARMEAAASRVAADDKLDAAEKARVALALARIRLFHHAHEGALEAARRAFGHPTLGPHARRVAALAALHLKRPTEALEHLAPLSNDAVLAPYAATLKARAHRLRNRPEEALALLDEEPRLDGEGLAEWRLERMRALLMLGRDTEAEATGAKLLDPERLTKAGDVGAAVVVGDLDAKGAAARVVASRPKGLLLRAIAVLGARRAYKGAVAVASAMVAALPAGDAARCEALSMLARFDDRNGRFRDALPRYAALRKECPGRLDLDLREGRARSLTGDGNGVTMLERATEFPRPAAEQADVAAFVALAKARPELVDLASKKAEKAAKDYAERDVLDVVMWEVAFDFHLAGRHDEALAILDRLSVTRPQDRRFWAVGRAGYYAAKIREGKGERDVARKVYGGLITWRPLSYYAGLAFERLASQRDALDVERAALARLGEARSPASRLAIPESIASSAGFGRALELFALGLDQAGRIELAALGLGSDAPEGARALEEAGDWLVALIEDRAGGYSRSHRAGRDQHPDFADFAPVGDRRVLWELAFPRAFRPLVEAAAQEFGIDPAIIWGIGREESGFESGIESYAHAIGVLQLILPTARAMAKPLGLPADEAALRDPPVNMRLGARYLSLLLKRFGREAHMAAGYNAGAGAVRRWLKARGEWQMDDFVEAIPFRQTRDYAKRVVGSVGVYRALYGDGRLPRVPLGAASERAGEDGDPLP